MPVLQTLDCRLPDLLATRTIAVGLARCLQPGMRLYLSGDLGSGKTTFARELLFALGHSGRVKSPTFTLMEPYNLSTFEVHHFDFYRLVETDAWRDAGFEESFDGRVVVLIEWPEKAGSGLPPPDLHLHWSAIDAAVPDGRRVQLEALSERGERCLNVLRAADCCAVAPSPVSD